MKTVLVIDDEPAMRRNLALILDMEGFTPIVATNGREGLELAKRQPPDLVLCDIMMPGMDGYAVLQKLRENQPTATVPFIFLTAKGDKFDLRIGMNLGADDYLAKPVDREELLAAITARLERKRAHDEHVRQQLASVEYKPDFSSPAPLEKLGLTSREAEVLLWVAQGKTNAEIALILGIAEKTAKRHLSSIFEKLGVESRTAATVRALEVLNAPSRVGD